MVYFRTNTEIGAAFQRMVGCYDYTDPIHRPDTSLALERAALQAGESVLEVGAGSGRLIAQAKRAVGNGFCVAVDAVQGFLNIDITWALNQIGLTVHPAGSPGQQVHLLHANATDGDLHDRIVALPGAPPAFDCIFAVHVLNTIPPDQRLQLLRTLRRLLKPNGRLIVTMSARFTCIPPKPTETGLPVQFRTTDHTEAPGSLLLVQTVSTSLVAVPQGPPRPLKKVQFALQTPPDRLWTTAAQQARAAAEAAGFLVDSAHPVGKGNRFGLPVILHSPPQSNLNNMSVQAIMVFFSQVTLDHGYGCVGRANDVSFSRQIRDWSSLPSHLQDYQAVRQLQESARLFAAKVKQGNDALGLGVLHEGLDCPQLGTMVVLRKA